MVRDSSVPSPRFASEATYDVSGPKERRESGLYWDLDDTMIEAAMQQQQQGDVDDPTLASMLIRPSGARHGHGSMRHSGYGGYKKQSARAAYDNEWLAEIPLEFIPDPPLFVPEPPDPHAEVPNMNVVPSYWKEHAGWLEDWPGVEAERVKYAMVKAAWKEHFKDSDSANGAEERTSGHARMFIHMGSKPVAVRSSPTQDPGSKGQDVIRPGQIIISDTIEENGGVQYYKVAGRPAAKPGWVFDHIGGETVMVEMKNVVTTLVWFRAVAFGTIYLHSAPSSSKSTMNGLILGNKEVFVVDMKCRVGTQDFVHLADGRGWIYERTKPKDRANMPKISGRDTDGGRKSVTAAQYVTVVEECEGELVSSGLDALAARLRQVPATTDIVKTGMWTYIVGEAPVLVLGDGANGSLLQPGEEVKVDKKCTANGDLFVKGSGVLGRQWFRLHGKERRGWVPATAVNGKQLLFEKEEQSAYPSWGTSARESVDATEDWMIGTV
mmetsp:Transcript_64447/g.174122  ORF Transcript_64447/g.174122 Transcript_64447/m.174122 type:complete len:495 (+) Transcript_64447:82-1566(+)